MIVVAEVHRCKVVHDRNYRAECACGWLSRWTHSRRQAIGAAGLHPCDPHAAPRLFR